MKTATAEPFSTAVNRTIDPAPTAADFETLVRTECGRLLGIARRMLGPRQEARAQKVVQDAFAALARFDGGLPVRDWLRLAVVHACLKTLRAQRRPSALSIEALLPRFLEDGHQQTSSQPWKPLDDAGIGQADIQALIRARIGELPAPYGEVYLLRDVAQVGSHEAAALLGIAPAAVETSLHMARRALRTLLDPHFAAPAW